MANFENPRNSTDASLIDSVAFGLATLEGHGDQIREIERLIQQVALARSQSAGALSELLWATENFLSSVTFGTLEDDNGSYDVLRDLSQYLYSTSSEEDASSSDTEVVDELLERLDFLASGGRDREIPKRDPKEQTSLNVFSNTKFPIEPSRLVENPWLMNSLEQARSTCHLLIANFKANDDPHSLELLNLHLRHLRSIEHQTREQSCITLTEFRSRLMSPLQDKTACEHRNEKIGIRKPSESTEHVFKSLANFLIPTVEDWMKCLEETMVNRPQATFQFKTLCKSEELILSLSLKGIKSKHADQLESTIASVESFSDRDNLKNQQPSSRGTVTSSKIQSSLLALINASRYLGGKIVLKNEEPNEILIEIFVNQHTRLAQVVPVSIDTNRYALEAHLVRAIVPTSIASREPYKNLVAHDGNSYEYETWGLARRIDQLESNESGFIVLLDCKSRKLAIHVDDVFAIEAVALRQSGSQVEYGNTMSLSPSNLLQLDPHSHASALRQSLNFKSKSLCLLDVKEQLADTFKKATMATDIECAVVNGMFDAIRSMQERRPRFLVLQSSGVGLEWLDQLRLANRHIDMSDMQILIASPDGESPQPSFQGKYSELKWIAADIAVRELAELLTSSSDSEELL